MEELIERIQLEYLRYMKDLTKSNWSEICAYKILPEEFMRKYQEDLNWHNVSVSQRLSEAFIMEFKDKVIWESISSCQKLSFPFIIDNIDRINLRFLLSNNSIELSDKEYQELTNMIKIVNEFESNKNGRGVNFACTK